MVRHVDTRDGAMSWRGNAARSGACWLPASLAIGGNARLTRTSVLATTALALIILLQAAPAVAASPKPVSPPVKPTVVAAPKPALDQMLVEANQSVYNRDDNTITLIGRVQIYYKRHTLQAEKVIYYNATKRVVAEGGVRLTEPGGNVVKATRMDVTKGFTEGFVEALRVDSTDRTRFEATSATRQSGNITVFQNGVYSACQACVIDTEKPPFWQIRAAKIIHNQEEKMVYYEDARLEFSGVPIAFVPFFQHPDPTIARKTGLLMPTYTASSKLGASISVPFYWAPTKDWDVTLQPSYLTRQGFLADVEIRHRVENGTILLRAVGINQEDRTAFAGTSGDRTTRGTISSKATFDINEQWKWGWDATLSSDRRFLSDYHLTSTDQKESTSQVFLTGLGERNFFDARLYSFQVFSDDNKTKPNGIGKDLQNKQPFAGTVDYDLVYGEPVLGGELSGKFNLTEIYRRTTDLDETRQVFGVAGNYTRASIDVNWRRQIIDPYGQIFTPFASARGDLYFNNRSNQATGVGVDWLRDGTAFRGMPTLGLEYRYPWLFTSTFGNHILEPIAQIVARPNETLIGKLPNEDAQSIVFDDTTLFQADKFSGNDRAEGGTRANLGLQYTFLMPSGAYASALFGQSYQLAGKNSFGTLNMAALEDLAKQGKALPLTAIGSGLATGSSDYVARFNVDSGLGLRIGTSARFAEHDFSLRRSDISLTGTAGALTTSLTWAYLKTPQSLYDLINASDPLLLAKFPNLLQRERSELQGSLNLKLNENWRLFGGARYDLRNEFVVSNLAGVGYDNDSFSVSLAYSEDTNRTQTQANGSRVVADRVIYLKVGLRTLGDASVSNSSSTTASR